MLLRLPAVYRAAPTNKITMAAMVIALLSRNPAIYKGPFTGRDWGQEDKGKTEDEMVGWHY